MSIAFDAATAASSTSLVHTCGASATILIAWTTQDNGTNATLTYNGKTVTQTGVNVLSLSSNGSLKTYYLPNPDTGSAFTLQSAGSNVSGLGCISLTGSGTSIGATTAYNDTVATTTGTSTNLVTTADNSMIVQLSFESLFGTTGHALTTTTGTMRATAVGVNTVSSDSGGSTQLTTAAGTYSCEVNNGGNNQIFGIVALEIPLPTSASLATHKTLLGVGI